MFPNDPMPTNDTETMRELARALFSNADEEEEGTVEQVPEQERQVSSGGIRKVVLPLKQDEPVRPGIRKISLEPKKTAESPVLDEPRSDLPSHPLTDVEEVPQAEESEASKPAPVEIIREPLRSKEIRQTMLRIQSGSLRPPFHVSHSPRRFASLGDALDFSRSQLPLPREMQLAQKPAHRTWLIAKINHCADQQALSNFAFSLDYKDLATLFPALASLKRGDEIDRIISIIMMRASKYLYIHGWITLQYAYPRSTVQKGLAELCEVLEKQRKNEEKNHAGRIESQLPPLQLGADRIDWKSVRMISEISMPNTRHFLASMIRYIRDSGLSGDEFFETYGIYRELPLGQAINSQWEMAMFEENLSRNSGPASPVRKLFSTPVEITGMQQF